MVIIQTIEPHKTKQPPTLGINPILPAPPLPPQLIPTARIPSLSFPRQYSPTQTTSVQTCLSQQQYFPLVWLGMFLFSAFQNMEYSTSSESTDLYQALEITHAERTESLLLQLEAVMDNQLDQDVVGQFMEMHAQSKLCRGGQLLDRQHWIMKRQEQENQLGRYEDRIRELGCLLGRKEEETWYETWSGKRVKNITLHRESLRLFHQDHNELGLVIKELSLKQRLEQEILNLEKQNQKTEIPTEAPYFQLRGIDTVLLGMLQEEETRTRQLSQVYEGLNEELDQLRVTQTELGMRYRVFSMSPSEGVAAEQDENEKEASSKTISTLGDESEV